MSTIYNTFVCVINTTTTTTTKNTSMVRAPKSMQIHLVIYQCAHTSAYLQRCLMMHTHTREVVGVMAVGVTLCFDSKG